MSFKISFNLDRQQIREIQAEIDQEKAEKAMRMEQEAKTAQIAQDRLFFNIASLFPDNATIPKERFLRETLKQKLLVPLDNYATGANWHAKKENTLLLISSYPRTSTTQLMFGPTHVSILPLHEPLTSEIRIDGLTALGEQPVEPGIILNMLKLPLRALWDEEYRASNGLPKLKYT
jgi:hypothetical protein